MIELVRIHRDAKGTTRWLEPVLERIHAMSVRFDGNADALVNDVWKQVADKSPTLGLFVAIEDEQIMGHALGFIRDWDGRWVAWLTQVQLDHVVGHATHDQMLAFLGEWVEQFNLAFKAHGIHVAEMMDCTPLMHDAWARHSGFTPYRYLMLRKIPFVGKG